MILNDQDRTEIEAIVARQSAAWKAGDAIAFAADAQEGIVFTNVVGMFSIGRRPFIGQHEHIFSTIYQGSAMAQEIVAITLVRPDVAIVDTLTNVTDAPHHPPGIELIDGAIRTRLEQVLVKDGNDWKVACLSQCRRPPGSCANEIGNAGACRAAYPAQDQPTISSGLKK